MPRSAYGHLLIILENHITSLSDDFNEAAPHEQVTKFPLMCKRVPANCQPFLLSLINDSVLLIPSDDPVKYFKLTNSSITYLNELSLKECFRYFPTGKGDNELYALCLKNQTDETTTVTYKIQYTEDFRLTFSQYGYGYGTHIDLDSPLIVTFGDSNDPVILYIANVGDDAELFIKELDAGGDVYDHIFLPSDCIGPYELRHLNQLDALLKCSNGLAYFYYSDTSEFAKLLVQGITMVERCANSSFFVVITAQGNILLNKTTSDGLIRIPFFKITVNLFQVDTISSFACYWNGTDTVFYFTVSQDDGMMYYVYIPLEYVAKLNAVTEAHQMLKLSTHGLSHALQSNIVGSAWVTKLTDEDHNVQETIFINIRTKTTGSHPSNGLSYVLSYQDKPFHSHPNAIEVKDDETESNFENSNPNKLPQFVTGILVSVCALIAITILVAVFRMYYKKQRALYLTAYTRVLERNGEELAEEHDTAFNDGKNQLTGQTVDHENIADVPDENNNEEEEDAAPPVNQNLPTLDHCNQQSQTTVDIHLQDDGNDNENVVNAHTETLGNRFNYSIPSEFTPAEEVNREATNSTGRQVTGALAEAVETIGEEGSDDGDDDGDDECSDP